jgi:FkbM family methyltransferase
MDATKGLRQFHQMTGAEPDGVIVAGVGKGKELPTMRSLWPLAVIHGYEPLKEFQNIEHQELDSFWPEALWDERGEQELLTSYRPDTRATMNELVVPLDGGGRRKVKTVTLDDALKRLQVPRNVLLWLDMQGSERTVMLKSVLLHPNKVSWINCELNCCPVRDAPHLSDVDRLLTGRGYLLLGVHSCDGTEMDGVYTTREIWQNIRHARAQAAHDRKVARQK